ncbi:hypothetical protein [Desulfobacula sp.]|uniref:hypothetical protein n=1 Tax=Desulfobacula sp. TaxID=2593537 RepID=UPI00260F7401|nr:hypothetical protein [Desulfobacula sp.]
MEQKAMEVPRTPSPEESRNLKTHLQRILINTTIKGPHTPIAAVCVIPRANPSCQTPMEG